MAIVRIPTVGRILSCKAVHYLEGLDRITKYTAPQKERERGDRGEKK